MEKTLIENQGGHGAIHNPFRRRVHRALRSAVGKTVARGVPIDYNVGSPFRATLAGKLPHKNQSVNSSCSGQAGSEFLQIDRIIRGVDSSELSAKSMYSQIAYPGGGATIQDLQKQIETGGANLESVVPSYAPDGTPLSESMMESKFWITPALLADAQTRAGYTSVDVDMNDIDAVAEAITTYGAVIWEITGQNGNYPGWQSSTPQPPSNTNPNPKWYHFMVAYDFMMMNGQKYIVALQSEGPTWGVDGVQYFSESYFTNGNIDPFTFTFNGNIQVPVVQSKPWLPQLADWFKGWFALDQFLGVKPS